MGTEETINKISLRNIIDYKKEIFSSCNIVLILTGSITERNIKFVNKELEDVKINNQSKPVINDIVEVQFKRKPKIKLVKCSWRCLDIQISFDVNLDLVTENELLFLSSILAGGDGSVLPKEVREKSRLVYAIYSDVEIYKQAAVLSISFSIDKGNLYIGLQKIMETLATLKCNISQRDIDMNMVFFTENLWYWEEDSYELNFQLGRNFIKEKKFYTIEEQIKRNQEISNQRLREVAEIIFQVKNTSIIIMGQTKKIEKKEIKHILQYIE